MKKLLISSLCAGVLCSCLQADFLRVGASASYYAPEFSGYLDYKGDLNTHTNFTDNDGEDTYQIEAFVEHFVPLIPNVKLRYTPQQDVVASSKVLQNSQNFYVGNATNSVDFDQLDATLYYMIKIPFVDLARFKFGLNAKSLDGTIETSQNGNVNIDDFSVVVPMAYIGGELEFFDMRAILDINYISYDSSDFSDITAKLSYDFAFGLGVEVGYRSQTLKLDDLEDISSDVEIKGLFAGVNFIF